MNKLDFLSLYFKDGPNKIQMIFNAGPFMQNETISISEGKISLNELLSYYVPKYEKDGVFDDRGIEEQIQDLDTVPLRVRTVVLDPAKWDLGMRAGDLHDIQQLTPLPIATDQKTGQSLILDSNHTIVNILNGLDKGQLGETYISIVNIVGKNLEDIIGDFKILNRTSKE